MPREVARQSKAIPAASLLAFALGAAAFAAVAIGALAIGRLAVGRLTIKSARFNALACLIHQSVMKRLASVRKPLMWRRIRLLTPSLRTHPGSHTRHDQRYSSAVLVSSHFPQEDHSRVRRWAADV